MDVGDITFKLMSGLTLRCTFSTGAVWRKVRPKWDCDESGIEGVVGVWASGRGGRLTALRWRRRRFRSPMAETEMCLRKPGLKPFSGGCNHG